jgi:hypothetical protein
VKSQPGSTRGYFAIGIEGASKAVNLGNLLRSAHAFGASFVFTIGADARVLDTIADTSKASSHLPLYHWRSIDELRLPRGCRLVGIELIEEAVELPAFAHPVQGSLCARPRARRARRGRNRPLPAPGLYSDRILAQSRYRRGNRNVRPLALPWPLC